MRKGGDEHIKQRKALTGQCSRKNTDMFKHKRYGKWFSIFFNGPSSADYNLLTGPSELILF